MVVGIGEQLPAWQLPPGHCASTAHSSGLLNGEQLPNEQFREMHSESKLQLSAELGLALALADAASQPNGAQATSIPTTSAETIRFMTHLRAAVARSEQEVAGRE